MVIGVIMLSLGLKKVLGYVGGDDGHTITDALYGLPLVALYGGAALYLLAHVGFKAYMTGRVSRVRIAAAVALLALIPLVGMIPALATLAVLAALLCALVGWETFTYAEERHRVRHAEGH